MIDFNDTFSFGPDLFGRCVPIIARYGRGVTLTC